MTDRDITRLAREGLAPVVILVEPQLPENIGTVARAMANFGLGSLRLVNPRAGWPNRQAYPAASGANRILDEAELFADLGMAIADLGPIYATTARMHDQVKPVMGPREAVAEMRARAVDGVRSGIVFGRERNGLLNGEVSLADRIVTYPVNPDFSSLNLAQAVLVFGYEWFMAGPVTALPFAMPERSEPATKAQVQAFFGMMEAALDKVEFFRPPERRETMVINLRAIILRMEPTRQDLATLHGAIDAIIEGPKGPARGGSLTEEEAIGLRAAALAAAANRDGPHQSPVRGIARMLRRNPSGAERVLWDAMVKDRRFAGRGFKRAIPIGPHVVDIVSFDLRVVVDVVPEQEDDPGREARTARNLWLAERGYRVASVEARMVSTEPAGALDRLAAVVDEARDVSMTPEGDKA